MRRLVSRERLGALSWLLCFQFFVAEQVTRVQVQGLYSMAVNAISDLGSIHGFGVGDAVKSDSPLHLLMNASFTLQGLLIVSGAIFARRFFRDSGLVRFAFAAFALAGLGVFVVGLVPEDTGTRMHVLAASVHFLCGSLAMLLLGCAVLKESWLSGVLSMAAGAIALGSTVLLAMRHTALWTELGLKTGVVERIAAYPLPIWLTVTGFVLLAHSRAPKSIV